MSKHQSDHSSNQLIREAIRAIALKGVVNRNTGVLKGTGKVTGFVAKIHTDETDELFGTIDVQEYADWAVAESDNNKIGYHEGVLLTAIQNDNSGLVIIPKLYSDVLLSKDPESGHEYVTMFSHVDMIQLDSHDKVSIGVREREDYQPENPDAPDIHELPLTGVKTNTLYETDTITTTVQGEQSGDKVSQVINPQGIDTVVGDGDSKTSSTMTQSGMEVKHRQGEVKMTDNDIILTQGSSKVKVTNGVVYVGDDDTVDDAVLGRQLAGILEDILGALSQVQTTTQLGPQPFINLPQFVTLKAKVTAFKEAHAGFLTPKVQIQK